MSVATSAAAVFLAASAAHAGFQLTVTVLVYPALAAVPASAWPRQHDLHSRRIVPVVGLFYGALVVTGVWLLSVERGPWTFVAVAGAAFTIVVTAGLAAPLHGRLQAKDETLTARLLRVDRLRLLGAVVSLVGALGVVLS